MKKVTQHTRWYRIEVATGRKEIRRFGVDETPSAHPTHERMLFTEWKRGTGPHSAEALVKIRDHVEKTFKGVPKSENQREKMRQAKLGRKFTPEHRANMAKSWQGKREQKRLRAVEAFALAAKMGKEYMDSQGN